MDLSVECAIRRWIEIRASRLDRRALEIAASVSVSSRLEARPPADPHAVAEWERRHGFELPEGLKAWLMLSDGLYAVSPLIHPLSAIGPMIAFAKVPGLYIQPESWFELGNPPTEPICVDLAYRGPDGDCPIFTSGDDQRASKPRLIAAGFDSWFLGVLIEQGREYWCDADFPSLGDPWLEHRKQAPVPHLPERLAIFMDRVLNLMRQGLDERSVADRLGLTRGEVESIVRRVQHAPETTDRD